MLSKKIYILNTAVDFISNNTIVVVVLKTKQKTKKKNFHSRRANHLKPWR